jgi:hypothetical protein
VRPGHLYIIIGTEEQEDRQITAYQGVYPTIIRAGALMSVSCSAPIATPVKIDMYDVAGRHTAHIYKGCPDHGILAASYRTVNLPAGIYFVRIATEEQETVHKVVITK